MEVCQLRCCRHVIDRHHAKNINPGHHFATPIEIELVQCKEEGVGKSAA